VAVCDVFVNRGQCSVAVCDVFVKVKRESSP
jgi:hypothetical protein